MGLFGKSKLSSSEQEQLKAFKRTLKWHGELYVSSDIAFYLQGKSYDYSVELLQNFEYKSAETVLAYCLKYPMTTTQLDLIFNDIIQKKKLSITRPLNVKIEGTSIAVRIEALQTLRKYKQLVEIDYSSVLNNAVYYNQAEIARYAIKYHLQDGKKMSGLNTLTYRHMPKIVMTDLPDLFEVSDVSEKDLSKHLIKECLQASEESWQQMLDAVIGNIGVVHLKTLEPAELITDCKDLSRVTYLLKEMRADADVLYQEQRKRAVESYDLVALSKLFKGIELSLEETEDFQKCLSYKLMYDGHDDVVKAVLEYGSEFFTNFSEASLKEHMPKFCGKCEDVKTLDFILKAFQKHSASSEILEDIGEHLVCFSDKAAQMGVLLNHTKFSPDLMTEWLNKAMGYDKFQDLCNVLTDHMDEFNAPSKSFVTRLISEQKIPLIRKMSRKGFYFREMMPYAMSCAGAEKLIAALKVIQEHESKNAFPYWKSQNDHTVIEVSYHGLKNEDELVTLCNKFNFRSGMVDQTYETFKGGVKTEIVPAGSGVEFERFNIEYLNAAENYLKRSGGKASSVTHKKKPSVLPSR